MSRRHALDFSETQKQTKKQQQMKIENSGKTMPKTFLHPHTQREGGFHINALRFYQM